MTANISPILVTTHQHAITSQIPTRTEEPAIGLEWHSARSHPVGGAVKRAVDLLIAISTLMFLAPMLVLIAFLIKLTMSGQILYSQPRVGYRGRIFTCYKFRTMVADADERLQQFLSQDPLAASEWAKNQKLMNDPRVTRLGYLLRRSSLDELPQFINVVLGDMSCVGPRPVVPAEIPRYGSYAREYFAARPGLTGLWQVSGRNSTSYARRIALDRYYVRRWSILLDMGILVRTIPALLRSNESA